VAAPYTPSPVSPSTLDGKNRRAREGEGRTDEETGEGDGGDTEGDSSKRLSELSSSGLHTPNPHEHTDNQRRRADQSVNHALDFRDCLCPVLGSLVG
jgi:hypothetical protein